MTQALPYLILAGLLSTGLPLSAAPADGLPEHDLAGWRLVEEERHEIDDRHAHAFSFRTYERRPAESA